MNGRPGDIDILLPRDTPSDEGGDLLRVVDDVLSELPVGSFRDEDLQAVVPVRRESPSLIERLADEVIRQPTTAQPRVTVEAPEPVQEQQTQPEQPPQAGPKPGVFTGAIRELFVPSGAEGLFPVRAQLDSIRSFYQPLYARIAQELEATNPVYRKLDEESRRLVLDAESRRRGLPSPVELDRAWLDINRSIRYTQQTGGVVTGVTEALRAFESGVLRAVSKPLDWLWVPVKGESLTSRLDETLAYWLPVDYDVPPAAQLIPQQIAEQATRALTIGGLFGPYMAAAGKMGWVARGALLASSVTAGTNEALQEIARLPKEDRYSLSTIGYLAAVAGISAIDVIPMYKLTQMFNMATGGLGSAKIMSAFARNKYVAIGAHFLDYVARETLTELIQNPSEDFVREFYHTIRNGTPRDAAWWSDTGRQMLKTAIQTAIITPAVAGVVGAAPSVLALRQLENTDALLARIREEINRLAQDSSVAEHVRAAAASISSIAEAYRGEVASQMKAVSQIAKSIFETGGEDAIDGLITSLNELARRAGVNLSRPEVQPPERVSPEDIPSDEAYAGVLFPAATHLKDTVRSLIREAMNEGKSAAELAQQALQEAQAQVEQPSRPEVVRATLEEVWQNARRIAGQALFMRPDESGSLRVLSPDTIDTWAKSPEGQAVISLLAKPSVLSRALTLSRDKQLSFHDALSVSIGESLIKMGLRTADSPPYKLPGELGDLVAVSGELSRFVRDKLKTELAQYSYLSKRIREIMTDWGLAPPNIAADLTMIVSRHVGVDVAKQRLARLAERHGITVSPEMARELAEANTKEQVNRIARQAADLIYRKHREEAFRNIQKLVVDSLKDVVRDEIIIQPLREAETWEAFTKALRSLPQKYARAVAQTLASNLRFKIAGEALEKKNVKVPFSYVRRFMEATTPYRMASLIQSLAKRTLRGEQSRLVNNVESLARRIRQADMPHTLRLFAENILEDYRGRDTDELTPEYLMAVERNLRNVLREAQEFSRQRVLEWSLQNIGDKPLRVWEELQNRKPLSSALQPEPFADAISRTVTALRGKAGSYAHVSGTRIEDTILASPTLHKMLYEDIAVKARQQYLRNREAYTFPLITIFETAANSKIGTAQAYQWEREPITLTVIPGISRPDGQTGTPISLKLPRIVLVYLFGNCIANPSVVKNDGVVEFGKNASDALHLDPDDVLVSAEQQGLRQEIALAKLLVRYHTDVTGPPLNALFMRVHGHEISRQNYFPIFRLRTQGLNAVSQQTIDSMIQKASGGAVGWANALGGIMLDSLGFLQRRTKAKSPILLVSALDASLEHADQVARVTAYYEPVLAASMVLSGSPAFIQETDEAGNTVIRPLDVSEWDDRAEEGAIQNHIKRVFGDRWRRLVLQRILIEATGASPGPQVAWSRFVNRLVSGSYQALLSFNLSSAAAQLSAIPLKIANAKLVLSNSELQAAILSWLGNPEGMRKEMLTYSAAARYRYDATNFLNEMMYGMVEDWLLTQPFPRRSLGLPTVFQQNWRKFVEAGLLPIEMVDMYVNSLGWSLAKAMVEKQRPDLKPDVPGYWDEVERQWMLLVNRTDNTSFPMEWNGAQTEARNDPLKRGLLIFTSAVSKLYSNMYRGAVSFRLGNRIAGSTLIAGVLAAGMTEATVRKIIEMALKPDKDPRLKESWLAAVARNITQSAPYGSVLFDSVMAASRVARGLPAYALSYPHVGLRWLTYVMYGLGDLAVGTHAFLTGAVDPETGLPKWQTSLLKAMKQLAPAASLYLGVPYIPATQYAAAAKYYAGMGDPQAVLRAKAPYIDELRRWIGKGEDVVRTINGMPDTKFRKLLIENPTWFRSAVLNNQVSLAERDGQIRATLHPDAAILRRAIDVMNSVAKGIRDGKIPRRQLDAVIQDANELSDLWIRGNRGAAIMKAEIIIQKYTE